MIQVAITFNIYLEKYKKYQTCEKILKETLKYSFYNCQNIYLKVLSKFVILYVHLIDLFNWCKKFLFWLNIIKNK